jgi:hypothetical protein
MSPYTPSLFRMALSSRAATIALSAYQGTYICCIADCLQLILDLALTYAAEDTQQS